MASLLAVDLGHKMGLALFGADTQLRWGRSHNIGSTSRLRRAVEQILDSIDDLEILVVEGDKQLAEIWQRAAHRRNILCRQVSAEQWRRQLLYPREQRSGAQAKRHAAELAKKIIAASGARAPARLRSDTAEAVLIGVWGMFEAQWLSELPSELRGR